VDWQRLKAVVLESDDWGLCAWAADDAAHRSLADTPAFQDGAGATYGRSTLESAADVGALAAVLRGVRGADGAPAVWQANTIVANPDYDRLAVEGAGAGECPLLEWPALPGRWARPGLEHAVRDAIEAGVWWPELHGLHHLPETAWLAALRRGDDDARRALAAASPVCEAVVRSSEYDPGEPALDRTRRLRRAHRAFEAAFGRAPSSLCPPDYRWDDQLEADAESLGVATIQGKAEQAGARVPALRRLAHRWRWPDRRGRRFYLPPRIAFEPRGGTGEARVGVAAARQHCHAAWRRGEPAVVSSHRVNYAHLDAAWSQAGRAALAELLQALATDGATFVTDAEVRGLVEHGVRGPRLERRPA
jgi:hypothetical protein